MRRVIVTAILGAFLVASPHLFATQEQGGSASLERAFPQNGRIRMDLSAGDYEISGAAANRIHVQWSVRDADQLPRVKANVDVRDQNATITTVGPSSNGLKVIIQVPERSDLYVRLTAGDLRLEDIRGNKDIELHAGDVRIDVGRAEDYHAVDASVWAGDIHAQPFHVIKGGLFRSFDWSGKGPYRLHAKLKAGDLRLYSKGAL
jgi:hypothetical protein